MESAEDLRRNRGESLSSAMGIPRKTHLLAAGPVVLSGVLLIFGGPKAGAQAPYQQQRTDEVFSLDAGSHSSVRFVDLDGDGDLDVLAGNVAGTFEYFENTGTQQAPAFVGAPKGANPFTGLDIGDVSAPGFGDLDGDGDLDLVTGERFGTLRTFLNEGSATSPDFKELSGPANPFDGFRAGFNTVPDLADLDGDGDLDVIAGSNTGDLSFLENTGTPADAVFVNRTGDDNPFRFLTLSVQNQHPDLADLEGDGDLDVIVGSNSGTFLWLENTGNSTSPAFVRRAPDEGPFDGLRISGPSSPDLVDLDGDGDLDLAAGGLYGHMHLFENTGSRTQPSFVAALGDAQPFLGMDLGFNTSPDLADLDSDGDMDLIVGEHNESLYYLENIGSGRAPRFTLRAGMESPFDGLAPGFQPTPDLVDLDADGDLDLVLGEFFGTLAAFENVGTRSDPAFVELTGSDNPFAAIDVGEISNPELADLDGDEDPDALVGNTEGTLSYFENTGSPTVPVFVERAGAENPFQAVDVGDDSSPRLVDLDGDGDLDAVVGSLDRGHLFFENTGTSLVPSFTERTGSENPFAGIWVGPHDSPSLADLDSDGDIDLVVGESGGLLTVFSSLAEDGNIFADGFESGDTSAWSAASP